MSEQEILKGRAIGISISESPDTAPLGLSQPHLQDAMTEVARHLLAMGCRLIYAGDHRMGGFTELLFELVARHRRNDQLADQQAVVVNYLAWPSHTRMHRAELFKAFKLLEGNAELICLSREGEILPWPLVLKTKAQDEPWAEGLTAMRRFVSDQIIARIVLGGRVEGFNGAMPGIAEEALMSLRIGQPLYLLGGFGGCTRDIIEAIGLAAPWAPLDRNWDGRDEFRRFHVGDLKNGLTDDENSMLATTAHIDQALALVIRGLVRRFGQENASPEGREK